jgi:hypothetical protein
MMTPRRADRGARSLRFADLTQREGAIATNEGAIAVKKGRHEALRARRRPPWEGAIAIAGFAERERRFLPRACLWVAYHKVECRGRARPLPPHLGRPMTEANRAPRNLRLRCHVRVRPEDRVDVLEQVAQESPRSAVQVLCGTDVMMMRRLERRDVSVFGNLRERGGKLRE